MREVEKSPSFCALGLSGIHAASDLAQSKMNDLELWQVEIQSGEITFILFKIKFRGGKYNVIIEQKNIEQED